MTTTAAPSTAATPARWSTKNKVGLGLALFYAVTNLPAAFMPPDTGDQNGPPMAILWVDTVLSAVALVACVIAWRSGNRAAARLTVGSLVVVTLTSLPAFFVDVPAGIKILVAAGVLWTLAFTVLILSPAKRG